VQRLQVLELRATITKLRDKRREKPGFYGLRLNPNSRFGPITFQIYPDAVAPNFSANGLCCVAPVEMDPRAALEGLKRAVLKDVEKRSLVLEAYMAKIARIKFDPEELLVITKELGEMRK
jgi:hypothetical protein